MIMETEGIWSFKEDEVCSAVPRNSDLQCDKDSNYLCNLALGDFW